MIARKDSSLANIRLQKSRTFLQVRFVDGEIKLIQQGKMITQCKVADFMKRPNAEFRDMMRKMR